ncbi:MAG TPA: class I SAM-dependent methyltransferase [Pyrinomonadaceae bacterium]|nr:class I SAM-dependent methyltransferase [Pyrinomonadaceae bacterium]
MASSISRIREDFDRIALLTESHGGSRDTYYKFLLRSIPPHCEKILDIGCGAGEFTRLLASSAKSVTGIDLSPQMIRLAEQQSAGYSNIEYVTDDVMRLSLPDESYDCVVSIATLHHLPLNEALQKMKNLLKAGGVLVINDLVADAGLADKAMGVFACGVSVARRVWKTGRIRPPKQLREAWNEHGKGETYLTLDEVKEMCRQHLPGARIHRHLLWRYTVIWNKSALSQ